MKICFATEVTYPNYVNRIKQSSLRCFIEKKLDELGVFYYISTNLPNNFEEYKNNDCIKVFGIDDLRKNNIESQKYELFPEDPTGLYPSRYPWNARRFIIEQAAKDGFDYIIYIDADTVFRPDLTTEEFYNQIISAYEPNTVKTNSTIFKYKSKSPEDVFNFHNLYIKHFNLNFEEDDYDTIDGPCQVFIGHTNQDILRLTSNWNKFAIFGYKREFGYGYGNNKHGNLSFVIPLSGFKLKWQGYPFYPNHITTDRYTHENRFTSVVEQPIEESPVTQTVSSDLSQILSSYSCDKVASKYTGVYEFLLNPLKDEKIKLLEIGVGTVSKTPLEGMSHVPSTMYGWKEAHQNYNPGASLRGWRDFFVNGEIYGVDIQPDCLIEEERIKTFIFDSRNTEKVNQHFEDDSLDIIIDDGNHDPNFQIHTIINFYKKLKNHGLYIIEDVVEPETVRNYLKDNNIEHVYHDVRMITIKKNGTINFTKNEVFDEMKKPEITELKPAIEIINFLNEEKEFKINGIKFADRGFFINLNKSTDRLSLVVKQIKQFNIEGLNRFEALTDEWIHFSCTKSHLKVFETSLLEDYDTIFVAEDDFLIEETCFFPHGDKQNIHDVLSKVSEDLNSVEWDVLLFGCNPKAPLIPITNNLAVVNKSTGAWAYLIKKRAYRYLLKNSNYKKDVIAIDDWLPILNDKGFITLTTIPLTINHGVGLVSTLQPAGPVNYDGWIKGSYHKFLYDLYPNNNFLSNNIQNNITVVIAGHFVDDFLFYLNYLLHSLPEELKKCKILVNYDISNELEPNAKKVMLSAFFRDVKHSMNTSVSFSYGGLISSIDNIIEQIRTPYFVFLEHDWVFLKKDSIDFNKLLTVFNTHNFVNAVWFAKDNNTVRAFEITDDIDGSTTPFIKEERVTECDLVTTCRWSNNPAIFRVSKFKEWFYGIIKNEHTGKTSQGSHNVEETMIPFYREIIKERGWNNVRDEWGTFLYGNIGEGPYVGHTDASRRYQGISKSQPEINGEEYIKNNPL
jgi:hypothetical protein